MHSVKPFNELTFAGKLRRLRALAALALAHYPLDDPEIHYHTYATNLYYRVRPASGERYMLRLASPGWRTYEDLVSEALWLDALGRETDMSVPRIIPARSGELVLQMSGRGIPNTWNTCLMSWVPGRLLGHYLTPPNLEKMGALFAKLHQHGAEWVPPTDFTHRRFEHWLSRGEENLIVCDGVSAPGIELSASSRNMLERMHQQVEAAYARLDRSDLRIIHCDLWHDNIKIYYGVLHPLDFEDTVWGFRSHDIAMAMLDLLEATDDERYAYLLAAFRRGYEAHLDWPDDRIEPFQIGRILWKINWTARYRPQSLMTMLDRHLPVFRHYERTGQVIRPAVE